MALPRTFVIPSIGFWAGTPLPAWDHGRRIDDMNKGGVDIEILSNPSMYSSAARYSKNLTGTKAETIEQKYSVEEMSTWV